MKIDIVYPLGTGSKWQDSELRFSLRSIEKNFIDKGTVWVIGHKPDWLINARHIPMPDKHKHNKDANIWINKVLGQIKTKDEAQTLVDAEVTASQTAWDNNSVTGETSAEKILRIGERPTDITLEE